jgi:hypothetical protein
MQFNDFNFPAVPAAYIRRISLKCITLRNTKFVTYHVMSLFKISYIKSYPCSFTYLEIVAGPAYTDRLKRLNP